MTEEIRGLGCKDTCSAHDKQVEHIEVLTLSVNGLVLTAKFWGKILSILFTLTIAMSAFSIRSSISLVSDFLVRIESIENKMAEWNKQISINTTRLNTLEEWRYDHIMEDRNRDEKIRSEGYRSDANRRKIELNESGNAKRWGVVNKHVINTDKKTKKEE